jgi:hypothetical protein
MNRTVPDSNIPYQPKEIVFLHSELIVSTIPFTSSSGGTGSGLSFFESSYYESRLGLAHLKTGTTSTGTARISTNQYDQIIFGTNSVSCESMINVPTLSTSTDRYIVKAGFSDSFSLSGTDGAFFEYSDNVNSGKFLCYTVSNASQTTADSGVTVAAGSWYRLGVEVSRNASEVAFFINGAKVASIATNIPSGDSRGTGFMTYILKSAGTTSRTLIVDSVMVHQECSR